MVLDPQLSGICYNAPIAIVLVVIVLEHYLISVAMFLLNNLWRTRRGPMFRQSHDVMTAVATNNIRDLSPILPISSKPLIVVRVSRHERMWPNPDLPTNVINL